MKTFQCECSNEEFKAIRYDDGLVNLKCTECGEQYDIAKVLNSIQGE